MKRALLAGGVLAVWIGATQFSAATINDVHFHHFHLNVVDPQRSSTFYQQVFGGVPIKFAGRTDAIFTERSFILSTRSRSQPPGRSTPASGISAGAASTVRASSTR